MVEKSGKLISFLDSSSDFYQEWYQGMSAARRDARTTLGDFWSYVKGRVSLTTRRDRFFRKHLADAENPVILDVACGYGRELIADRGFVVGLDLVLDPLLVASELYDLCVHADASSIPFPDSHFDFVVSSDFLGHVPLDRKDELYQEFRRVLKPRGRMLHVVETDANNWHFRFAHRYPELFEKYFVEAIGGHFGLELPSKAIGRIEANGFRVVEAKKIWGELWQVEEYGFMFDNEYKRKWKLIAFLVLLSKALSVNGAVKEVVNILLNPVSALAERVTPLDNAQGLLVVCAKVDA